jgi:putative hemolysin
MDPASIPPTILLASSMLVLLLILLMGAFAMAEAALLSLRSTRVEQLVEEGRRGAKAVQTLLENQPRMIATTQVGVTLCGFTAAAVAATVLSHPLVPLVQSVLHDRNNDYSRVVASALITIPVAVLAMAIGGMLPKTLALQAPDHWAMRLAPLVRACTTLFTPFSALILGLARTIAPQARFEAPMMTRGEFEKFVDDQGKGGGIDEDEEEIIKNIIEISETEVREVMTPRVDMAAVPVTSPPEKVVELILASGHSRIAVYAGTIDNVIGILHAKDLLRLLAGEDRPLNIGKLIRPPYFVPENRRVADLLEYMRHSHQQLAIVQDEYAGTAGIVTIEDLLEEIVGEIKDEYDVDEPEFKVLSPTETLFDSRLSLDDINERLGTALEHEDYTTIGGYVFGILGHEAAVGERVVTEGVEFVVEKLEGRRIKTIRATRLPELIALSPSPPTGED